MTGNIDTAIEALDRRFLLDHPIDAVRLIESLDGLDAAEILENQAVDTLLPVWRRMLPGDGAEILNALPDAQSDALIAELLPHEALRFLNLMKEDERENILFAPGSKNQRRNLQVDELSGDEYGSHVEP